MFSRREKKKLNKYKRNKPGKKTFFFKHFFLFSKKKNQKKTHACTNKFLDKKEFKERAC